MSIAVYATSTSVVIGVLALIGLMSPMVIQQADPALVITTVGFMVSTLLVSAILIKVFGDLSRGFKLNANRAKLYLAT